jgi:putative ABC transport system substrate-binding protein
MSPGIINNRIQPRIRSRSIFSIVVLMFALSMILTVAYAESKNHIVIITSSRSDYQQKTARIIQERLEESNAITMLVSADNIASASNNNKTLYVAIGEHAITKLHEFDANAFALRLTSRQIPGVKYTSAQSDLITMQPTCRNIHLVKAINPGWDSIAVLSSRNSLDTAAELTRCAIKQNINLQVYAISDDSDLLKTLETAVENNKVLLAITDPLIYNSHSVKNILLTAYRHRKPVIGYSGSFVRAGAVAAIYTSAQYTGNTAAELISDFLQNSWQFDKNIYKPDDFSVIVNRQVASSLEIVLPSEESLKESIKEMEQQP